MFISKACKPGHAFSPEPCDTEPLTLPHAVQPLTLPSRPAPESGANPGVQVLSHLAADAQGEPALSDTKWAAETALECSCVVTLCIGCRCAAPDSECRVRLLHAAMLPFCRC
jgi:hypothetical protein